MPLYLFQDRKTGLYELLPECCQCGACCTLQPCRHAIDELGAPPEAIPGRTNPYPALEIDAAGHTSCRMIREQPDRAQEFGAGAGCCLKAQVVDRYGRAHLWRDLPDDTKRQLAGRMRTEDIPAYAMRQN